MKFIDPKIVNALKEFKDNAVQTMERLGISRCDLSAEFSVSDQTVSRWFHPFDDCSFPAFLIKRCIGSQNEKLKEFGLELERYMTEDAGYSIIRNIESNQLDGDLANEVCESATHVGIISQYRDIPPEKLQELSKHADLLIAAGFSMKAEIKNKRGKLLQ